MAIQMNQRLILVVLDMDHGLDVWIVGEKWIYSPVTQCGTIDNQVV